MVTLTIGEPNDKKDKLRQLTVKELKEKAKEKDIEGYSNMKKDELIKAIEGD